MKYSEAVLNRVRDPRCAGTLSADEGRIGTGEAGSLESGTLIRLQVRVDAGRVEAARFKAFGCSAAIASASFVAERVQQMTVEEARALRPEAVIAALVLPPERTHVATLAIEAAHAALDASGFGTERQDFSPGEDNDDRDH